MVRIMNVKTEETYTVRLYLSGPVEVAKQVLREECMREGLCVTIEPTTYIYTGGEEAGYVVGLLNYPRFPCEPDALWTRAEAVAVLLLRMTFQHSALMVAPDVSRWLTLREESGGERSGSAEAHRPNDPKRSTASA
jgi:hypothetical protein